MGFFEKFIGKKEQPKDGDVIGEIPTGFEIEKDGKMETTEGRIKVILDENPEKGGEQEGMPGDQKEE